MLWGVTQVSFCFGRGGGCLVGGFGGGSRRTRNVLWDAGGVAVLLYLGKASEAPLHPGDAVSGITGRSILACPHSSRLAVGRWKLGQGGKARMRWRREKPGSAGRGRRAPSVLAPHPSEVPRAPHRPRRASPSALQHGSVTAETKRRGPPARPPRELAHLRPRGWRPAHHGLPYTLNFSTFVEVVNLPNLFGLSKPVLANTPRAHSLSTFF